MRKLSQESLFTLLGGSFIAIILISTIASTKIVAVGPFIFDAGTILFPLSYVIAGILTELQGSKRVELLLVTGLIAQVLASATFMIVAALPAQADWHNQAAYEAILGVVPRIAVASLVAYTIGEFCNVRILSFFKKHITRRGVRLALALAIAQTVDTILFSSIAFAGTMPFEALLALMGTVLAIKLAVVALLTPLSAYFVGRIQARKDA